jgi:enoyl-CoA hydratase
VEVIPDTKGSAELLLDRVGETLVVTLNRPSARNALTVELVDQLQAAYAMLDASDDLRVAILTGAGGCFSSGMDLKQFAQGRQPSDAVVRHRPRKPLIGAIEGFALAGGLELALACDLIVAARDAVLGIPEVKRGVVAVGGGLLRLPARLPFHIALELALTGERLGAERAAEYGLVNRISEPGCALADALELAERIAANAPLALIASKEIIWKGADVDEGAWERQQQIAAHVLDSDDAHEGAVAFTERRPPRWSGR